MPRIVDHLPERMTYLDRGDPRADGSLPEKQGRIILSGGEFLLEPLREPLSYPLVERIAARYRGAGGVKVVVQTTGDLLTDAIVDALLARGVWMISVASIDDYHVGLEGEAKQQAFVEQLTRLFERHGMRESAFGDDAEVARGNRPRVQLLRRAARQLDRQALAARARLAERPVARRRSPTTSATAGRAGSASSSHRFDGSEVSIEPDGNVYPCCIKTQAADRQPASRSS